MFCMCCHSSLLEGLSAFSVTPFVEDSWKPVASVLQNLPHVPFPFADFALCPFKVINLSCTHSEEN